MKSSHQKRDILQVKSSHPEWSATQVAEYLTMSKDEKYTKDSVQKVIQKEFLFSEDARPLPLPETLRLMGDWMVVGDVHVPNTSPRMVDKLIATAKSHSVDNLAVVGDLFNMDTFSIHPKVSVATTFERETKAARELMKHLRAYFKKVAWCRGNHDQRLSVLTQGQIGMEHLAATFLPDAAVGEMPDNFLVSPYNFMWLESSNAHWMLTHQFGKGGYSPKRLSVASNLAMMHQCNILSHHEHHAGITISPDGRWTVANNPALSDGFEYVELNVSTTPMMCLGFSMICGGRIQQYVDGGLYGIE